MLNSRDYRNTLPVLILALCNFYTITAAVDETNDTTDITTSASASTSSCTPLNCVPACTPSCGNQETCVLRTMTNCAVCPSSQCINRTTLGLPPVSTSSQSSPSNSGSSNSGLIGGIVGTLASVGVLIGIGVFCYIKRAKKKRKLPFAFTDGGLGVMSQEKFQSYPSGTLTQHPNRSAISPASEPTTTSRYISLSELAKNNHSPTAMQYRSNLVPPPTPQHTYNNNNQSTTTSLRGVSTVNTNNNNNTNYNNPNDEAIYRNSINNNQQINANLTTPTTSHYTELSPTPLVPAANVPEEFEERIAIQNKRISQILNTNPRLSRGSAFNQAQQQLPLPIDENNRTSGISFTTTDDDSEYDDDDDRSVSSSANQPKQAVMRSRSVYQQQQQQPQSATQAVQVTRAKPQIMRVNSVRSSSNTGVAGTSSSSGLGRSDSVRTILTAVNTPPYIPQLDLAGDSLFTESFPATPNNRSVATLEDPFLDTKK